MAVKVIRKFRNLFDVTFGTPNDGDVPTYDQATDKLVMSAPAGGGNIDDAVILAPAASARNVIVPTAGDVIAAVLKAHAAQSVDLLQFRDSSGNPILTFDELGQMTSGSRIGAGIAPLDLNPTIIAHAGEVDIFGATFSRLSFGARILAQASLAADDGGAYFTALQAAVRGPDSAARHAVLFGIDVGSIFRGTAAQGGATQVNAIYGGRLFGLDYDYGAEGDSATGTVGQIVGAELYASHAGQNDVGAVIGASVYAESQTLIATPPGDVTVFLAGTTTYVNTDNQFGTLPALYGHIVQRSDWSPTPVTLAASVWIKNWGLSGTDTSYAIKIDAQSGSATTYAIHAAGGLSVLVDGVLIGKTSAFADGVIVNGQGGWWWDQANSLPKWKGKTSGGVIVNFTPADAQALADHLADTSDAHDASAISVADAGNYFTGTDVEAALQELADSVAGGGAISVTQTGHGLAVGDVVKLTGADTYAKAQADSEVNAEVAGIVSAVADANNFSLVTNGDVTGLSGLTPGAVYFLSPSTAGTMTTTEPSTVGQVSKPVLIARTTTAGLFFNMRGAVVGSSFATNDIATAYVDASESTTSTSYTDLATVGPSVTVTVGASGMLLLLYAHQGDTEMLMAPVLSGANTLAADDDYALYMANSLGSIAGRHLMLTGLNPGPTTITLKYRVVGGTRAAGRRMLTAIAPLTQAVATDDGSGWRAANETWTYGSADDPTYTFTISGDLTGKYSAGMRVRLSQSTGGTKYFIVTKVAHSSGTTTITVYGGTDYDLNNETISSPYYSVVKAPVGFPLDPAKWTVETVDTSSRSQASPTQNTWYNLGSLSLVIPIGAWDVSWKASLSYNDSSVDFFYVAGTLSTANNSESDADFTAAIAGATTAQAVTVYVPAFVRKHLALAAKTTYYLNARTVISGQDSIAFRGDQAKTVIRAVCAYL